MMRKSEQEEKERENSTLYYFIELYVKIKTDMYGEL